MKHEFRWKLARIGGFTGLTVGAGIEHISMWIRGLQMPYIMPHVWHAMLAVRGLL